MIIQIDSGYFCAGLVHDGVWVTHAAPIIKYMVGWHVGRVYNYCWRKNWKLNENPMP